MTVQFVESGPVGSEDSTTVGICVSFWSPNAVRFGNNTCCGAPFGYGSSRHFELGSSFIYGVAFGVGDYGVSELSWVWHIRFSSGTGV